jgi:hypothetical protein
MRKSAWFLAAALTAFVMTMLASIVYAYTGLAFAEPSSPTQVASQDQATSQTIPRTEAMSAPTQQAASVSPQDAASIAANFLKRYDPYSVQLSPINGLNLYKVTFGSGDVVYVSMDGQVILTVPAPQPSPTAITMAAPGDPVLHRSGGGHSSSGSGGGHSGSGEHDGGGD